MKKLLLTLIVGVCISGFSFAQVNGPDYKAGIGIRLSGSYYDAFSASLKVFISEPGAFEFNVGVRDFAYGRTNLSASAAYQHHFPIGDIEGFKWFVGGGLMIFNSFVNNDNNPGVDDSEGFGFSVFPTGGAEYKFRFPLVVSADFRPQIVIVKPYNESFNPGFGVSARYTFR